VARMEDVLDLYAAPPDPARPIICLDELPLPLRDHVRSPLPPAVGVPAREDYEYKRCGTAALAMAFDPHRGWRHVWVSERRTREDFAGWVQELVDVCYPEAEVIQLVTDNLNTHGPGAFYEAFPAAEARRLAQKIAWHYTPKHGSWLNMVEIELSVLSDQCLDRRLPDLATVAAEVAAWEVERNAARATIDWRFTTAAARTKLHRLYPFADPVNP
jgi:DDE superfamily endonuclease